MGCEVVALRSLRDEGAQFDVLPHHLLCANLTMQFAHAVRHAVEGHLSRVGNIGEDRVIHITIDGLHDGRQELLTQLLALVIDVTVRTSTEVDTLERTSRQFLCCQDLFQMTLAVLTDNQRLTWLEFLDILCLQIEGGLDHRALRSQDYELIILIVERRTDAPGITHSEHLTRARETTHHITSIEMVHRGLQHIRHLHMVVDITGDGSALQALLTGLSVETLHLTIQTMAHQFERDIGITIDTRGLSLSSQERKDLVDVGHIEVTTQTEVLGAPVVTTQEGMHILQAALTCGGIAQMAHIELTSKRLIDVLEHLCDGILALCTLTKHIFLTSRGVEVHTGHTSTLLTTVVLFLHHQIEFVQAITPRAVFLFIIRQGL